MLAGKGRRYFKEMRLQQLRGFCETARRQSFSAAAAALGISRPAVWQQIRALEQDFATSLVRRKGRGVELTQDGQLLLQLVLPLVTGFNSIKNVFEDRQANADRQLVVVTTASLLANELKGPVQQFRRRFPRVHLTLVDRPSFEALKLLENDQADLAIAGHLEEERRNPLMDYEPLFAHPFMLVCPRNHELARRRTISLRALVRYPMVLTAKDSRSRSRVERVFERQGLLDQLDVVLDTTNGHLSPDYVALGLGITVIPLGPDSPVRRKLHVRSLAQLFGDEPVVLVRKKGKYELPHVSGFREIVRQALARPDDGEG